MRLLNSRSLKIKEFFGDKIPKYAVLSHTWGDEEVSFQDFHNESVRREKGGFKKIEDFCYCAEKDGFEWVWVDTCCIDKTSSAEISEAINSMYRWYQRATACFVYLADVSIADIIDPAPTNSEFQKSLWFTRGWTLQELLAPSQVTFYNSTWDKLGGRHDLSRIISEITNIPERFLANGSFNIHSTTIAERISWVSTRKTSREEDIAYCLLGLLDVQMPLIYGEGTKAFHRLQEEIIRSTHDHTILAWGAGAPSYLQPRSVI
ncbi:hypothetical protein M426DRAFT_33740, partial [Hypoxylon sp. CI-4A]